MREYSHWEGGPKPGILRMDEAGREEIDMKRDGKPLRLPPLNAFYSVGVCNGLFQPEQPAQSPETQQTLPIQQTQQIRQTL